MRIVDRPARAALALLVVAALGVLGSLVDWPQRDAPDLRRFESEHTIDTVVPAQVVELYWRELLDDQRFGPERTLARPAPGETLRVTR